MPLRYRNPPLIEALCEIRFASDGRPWDRELLYSRIAKRFRIRKEPEGADATTGDLIGLGQDIQSISRLRFFSDDQNLMVQVGPDLLAVNSVKQHLGWAELRDTFLEMVRTYREVAVPTGIEMIGVRYINRVEIPLHPGFSLERYFTVLPALPDGVQVPVSMFFMSTEAHYENPAAIFRFRVGTTESAENTAAFVFDYEHLAPGAMAPDPTMLAMWLDASHDRIERAFYGSFKPRTHIEVFEEIRP